MTATGGDAPTPAAERLLDALARPGRKRVSLDHAVWPAFQAADPAAAAAFDRRRRLRALLDELARTGRLALPRQSRLYDTSAEPPLPVWIRLTPAAAVGHARGFDHTGHAWHPRLAFLADQPSLPNATRWRALDAWLKAAPDTPTPAVDRERSYEVFGDEKALEAFVRTELFRRHLPYGILACYPLYEPLAWEVCDGPNIRPVGIVIENPVTWHTVANWNRDRGVFAAVVYGRGNSFMRAWRDLDRLRRYVPLRGLLYFGDIDRQGLAIPEAAARARTAREDADSPLKPCETLYALLLDRIPAERWQTSRDARSVGTRLSEWLGEPLARRIRPVLDRHRRIPQEAVQRRWLDAAADELAREADRLASAVPPDPDRT